MARLLWGLNLLGNVIVLAYLAPRSPRDISQQYQFQIAYPGARAIMDLTEATRFVLGLDYLLLITFFLLGLFLVWRKPDDLMALMTSALLIGLGVESATITFMESRYQLASGFAWLESLQSWIVTLSLLGYSLYLYIFPDGRFVPRMAGRILAIFLVISLPAIAFTYQDLGDDGFIVLILYLLFLVIGGLASQIYRYRFVSTFQQKQQLKLVVAGLAIYPIFGTIFGVFLAAGVPNTIRSEFNFLAMILNYVAFLLVPISMTVSILRYHLWDIDLLIRRTLVYSLLSGLLGTIYFGGVALLQTILPIDRSTPSPVIIVVTTLAIAALFNPLRKRIQDFIDRRFYRQKYDAERALAEFAATARSETDLGLLSEKLVEVVQQTVQPESTRLWLKGGGSGGRKD